MEPLYSLNDIEHNLGNSFCLKVPRLDLSRGNIHVVSGANGAGKSTLLKILAILLQPQHGSFCFDGQIVHYTSRNKLRLRRKITLVDQSPYLFQGSVFNNLAYGLKIRGIDRIEQEQKIATTLLQVGLDDFAQRQVRDLSGGEVQRVALARALVLNPEVLLLDEPTANIDHDSVAEFEKLLGDLVRAGTTVIMSTHDPTQAERLNGHLIKIQNGVVIDPEIVQFTSW